MQTPFNVEFARESTGRDGAPTLVPVAEGGARVDAQLLVLDERITAKAARDMLYRRETGKIGTDAEYVEKDNPGPNTVCIRELSGEQGAETILYTSIGANVHPLTSIRLAFLAIKSAFGSAGQCKRDGITYLRDTKAAGIRTPLMREYESAILQMLAAETLPEAISTAAMIAGDLRTS